VFLGHSSNWGSLDGDEGFTCREMIIMKGKKLEIFNQMHGRNRTYNGG
jgi:hypothetical protein